MRHLRCVFCHRNQLPSPSKWPSSSFNFQLLEITPTMSAHKLCLRSSYGLSSTRSACDYTLADIEAELKRCAAIACAFCNKEGGASAKCAEESCSRSFHLACSYERCKGGTGRRGKAVLKAYCQLHQCDLSLPQGKDGALPPSKRPAPACKKKLLAAKEMAEAVSSSPKTPVKQSPRLNRVSPPVSPLVQPSSSPKRSVRRTRLCNAVLCVCPQGFNYVNTGSWALRFCMMCGDSPVHMACLAKMSPGSKSKWRCVECTANMSSNEVENDAPPPAASTTPVPEKKKRGRKPKNSLESPSNAVAAADKKITPAALSMMKSSFCKDLDTHFRKRTGRSPLSMKQKEDDDEDIMVKMGETEGEESPEASSGEESSTRPPICTFKIPPLPDFQPQGKENQRKKLTAVRKDKSKWIVGKSKSSETTTVKISDEEENSVTVSSGIVVKERKKPGPKPGWKKVKQKPGPKPGLKAAMRAAAAALKLKEEEEEAAATVPKPGPKPGMKRKNQFLDSSANPAAKVSKKSQAKPKVSKTSSLESSPAKKFVENCAVFDHKAEKAKLKTVKKKLFDNSKTSTNDLNNSKLKSTAKTTKTAPVTTTITIPAAVKTTDPKQLERERQKAKKLVRKISVEPKPVHERQLFHVRNAQPQGAEPEAEEDYQWLSDLSIRYLDEFVDLNDGEKEFMKLWNRHSYANPCQGDRMMLPVLKHFIKENAAEVMEKDLYRNFVLHITNMTDFGILNRVQAFDMIRRMQRKMINIDDECEDLEAKELEAAKEEETASMMMNGVGTTNNTANSALTETNTTAILTNSFYGTSSAPQGESPARRRGRGRPPKIAKAEMLMTFGKVALENEECKQAPVAAKSSEEARTLRVLKRKRVNSSSEVIVPPTSSMAAPSPSSPPAKVIRQNSGCPPRRPLIPPL